MGANPAGCHCQRPTDPTCNTLEDAARRRLEDIALACDGAACPAAPLREHFLSLAYRNGLDMDTTRTGYRSERASLEVPVYRHLSSGVQVWSQAIMLASPPAEANGSCTQQGHLDVVFHYTSEETFNSITTAAFVSKDLWADLKHESSLHPPGVYASGREPAQMGRQASGTRKAMPPGSALASHCLPIMLPKAMMQSVSDKDPCAKTQAQLGTHAVATQALAGCASPPEAVWLLQVPDEEEALACAAANMELRFRRILQACESDLGADHVETLDALSFLAYLLDARGRHDEAEPLYKRALAGYRHRSGELHPDTLRSLNNLAALLQAQGKLSEAEPLARAALRGSEEAFGQNDPNTATSMNNLAYLLQALGNLEEAERLFRKTLHWRETVLGVDHPDTLLSVQALGVLLESQGKLKRAEHFYRRALAGLEDGARQGGPSRVALLGRLADVLHMQERLEEAEPFARQAWLETCQAEAAASADADAPTGPEGPGPYFAVSPAALSLAYKLAHLLGARGFFQEAEQLYRHVYEGRLKQLGPSHADTLISMTRLARTLEARGRAEAAEEMYRKALSQGAGEPQEALRLLKSLGRLLQDQGRLSEAESVRRLALQRAEDLFGKDSPEALSCLHSLAFVLDCQDKFSQAEPLYRRALKGREALLGSHHKDTLDTLTCLACLLNAQGTLTEADPLFHRILQGRLVGATPGSPGAPSGGAAARSGKVRPGAQTDESPQDSPCSASSPGEALSPPSPLPQPPPLPRRAAATAQDAQREPASSRAATPREAAARAGSREDAPREPTPRGAATPREVVGRVGSREAPEGCGAPCAIPMKAPTVKAVSPMRAPTLALNGGGHAGGDDADAPCRGGGGASVSTAGASPAPSASPCGAGPSASPIGGTPVSVRLRRARLLGWCQGAVLRVCGTSRGAPALPVRRLEAKPTASADQPLLGPGPA